MDGVDLEISLPPDVHLAQDARKTVREGCVRSWSGTVDTMFDLPALDGVAKVVVDGTRSRKHQAPVGLSRQAKASA
jgi:ATP-dependent Clp protease ATP-binding subunit ClpX